MCYAKIQRRGILALASHSFPQICTRGSDASTVIMRDGADREEPRPWVRSGWPKRGKEARPVPPHQEGRETRAASREWESERFLQYRVLLGRPGDDPLSYGHERMGHSTLPPPPELWVLMSQRACKLEGRAPPPRLRPGLAQTAGSVQRTTTSLGVTLTPCQCSLDKNHPSASFHQLC